MPRTTYLLPVHSENCQWRSILNLEKMWYRYLYAHCSLRFVPAIPPYAIDARIIICSVRTVIPQRVGVDLIVVLVFSPFFMLFLSALLLFFNL